MPWPSPSTVTISSKTVSWNERLGLAALMLTLFVWTLRPLAGFDFWFYLAMGRELLETREVPWAQSFLGTTSVLAFGRYADVAWLGNLVCYLAFWAAGPLGLVLLKSFLLVVTTGLVYVSSRLSGMSAFWAGAWCTLGLWTIRGRFEMRTYLFSDLALALLVLILILAERGARTRNIALALAALFVVWTNLHQGVIAGFLVIGCWMVFGRRPWKERVALTALAGLCGAVKPHALSFPAFLYDHFANASAIGGVVEWAAPEMDTIITHLGPFYLIAALVLLSAARRWRRGVPAPPWGFAIIALLFAALAARSIRSISEVLPVVCPLLAGYFPALPSHRRPQVLVGVCLVGMLALTYQPYPLAWLGQTRGYPSALVDALNQHGGEGGGQVFNSFEFGNYLVFRQVPPFIHGMTALYKEQLITDFQAVLNPTPRREAILDQFKVDAALLHLPTNNDATLSLVDSLADSPDWKLELWDDTGLLFVRGAREHGLTQVRPWRAQSWTDPLAAEAELQGLIERQPSALAYLLLSRLQLERGELAQATRSASQATELSPYFYQTWSQLGLCYAKANNLFGVLSAAQGGLVASGGSAAGHYNMGLALMEDSRRQGGLLSFWQRQRASYHARRALWSDPDFAPARQLLDQL